MSIQEDASPTSIIGRRLLRLHGSRLVVRGGDDDLDDERWARNASASLYLPGKLAEGRLKHLLENLSC